jgi:hypothetical protein
MTPVQMPTEAVPNGLVRAQVEFAIGVILSEAGFQA